MHPLLLPSTIRFEDGASQREGRVVVEPCEGGFGTTLGNALRRVLLSSLPGAAVTDIKIDGVHHEFSTVPGVKEDIVQIILNVKQMRLRVFSDEPVRLTLSAKGEHVVTAGDIDKNASVEIVNPDQRIATLTDAKAALTMEFIVQQGRGYDPVESRTKNNGEIGLLAVDALYTPMRNVGFRVEHVRVGQITNYDRLIMDIETDGSVTVKDAVEQATKILMDHFNLFLNPPTAAVEATPIIEEEKKAE